MSKPTDATAKSFATPAKLRQWLKANHARREELWIKVRKKHTDTPSMTWNEIVIETPCYGWINRGK